jgi:hypothetical protein
MKKLLLALTSVAALVAVSLLLSSKPATAALGSSNPPLGLDCTIQFRRDALGTAASLPVPPLSGAINGADTSLVGKLKSVNGEWVVVERAGGEIWIPKSVVLLVEFHGK